MTSIETARLILRPFVLEDVDALHAAVYGDPDAMRFIPPGFPRPLEKTRSVVEFFIDQAERNGYSAWAMTLKDSSELIGQCGLGWLPEIKQTEVLYALGKAHWGKGFATEGAQASLRYGFSTVGLGKIVALAHVDNIASQRVMQKLGMTYRRTIELWSMKLKMFAIPRDKFRTGDSPYRLR